MLIAALGLALSLQDPPPPPPPPVIRIDPRIQAWLDRDAAAEADAGPRGPVWDDGRVHGEVSVSVGTGGHRAYGGWIDVPLGGGGRLSLGVQESEGEVWGAPHPRDPRFRDRPLGADDRPLDW